MTALAIALLNSRAAVFKTEDSQKIINLAVENRRLKFSAERQTTQEKIMSKILAPIILLLMLASANAQGVTVADAQTVTSNAGEAQSTVVPPGVNKQCPNGRFLVSNDGLRPPTGLAPVPGLIVGRDLNNPGGPDITATFDQAPGWFGRGSPRYSYVTNDHDLLSLPNGDVLYLTGAGSRASLASSTMKFMMNPPWFDTAYRGDFGPGARSVLLTWRSTDCGQNFKYTGEFDPARMEDGSCAMPQFPATIKEGKKVYNMGGSDGQLVTADADGRLYLTFQCVGYLQDKTQQNQFTLSTTPVNKILVATSDNEGATWKSMGFINNLALWRLGVLALDDDNLAFGTLDGVLFGKRNAKGKFDYDASYAPANGQNFGWDSFPYPMGDGNPYLRAYVWANTVIARSPGSDSFFIVYPDTIPNKGHGHRLFFYNRAQGQFNDEGEDDPIVPEKAGMSNFTFHLSAIDPGIGPVMLYWYDVDGTTKKVKIRGRFITKEGYSSDFDISKSGGQTHSFTLTKTGPPGYWYGDYNTAAGFVKDMRALIPGTTATSIYDYYPIWIEPDGAVHFAKVEYTEKVSVPNLNIRRIPLFRRRPMERISLDRVRLPQSERENLIEHSRRQTAPATINKRQQ